MEIESLVQLAETGDAVAQKALALYYYRNDEYEKGVVLFEKLANDNDAISQYYLGKCYNSGNGIDKDYKKAVYWFTKAAEQGNPQAMTDLALCFMLGEGVEKDLDKASELLSRAEAGCDIRDYCRLMEYKACILEGQGDYPAYYSIVSIYSAPGLACDNCKEINKELNPRKVCPWMLYRLSKCYEYGYGVSKNPAKNIELMTQTANLGYANAQFFMGYYYECGHGVEKNYEKSFEWYSKSAEQGVSAAQFNLAFLYENGRGVEKSYEKAFEWYSKSAEQGDAKAQVNLAFLYENGRGVEKSYEKAFEWYSKSAEQGDAKAQYALGCCYMKGVGVEKNYEKAFEWYSKSAEQGNAKAQFNLAFLYENGRGVEKSYEKAFEWYSKSAEQGNAKAQYALGWCYENGQGVDIDISEAVKWYHDAVQQGYELGDKDKQHLEILEMAEQGDAISRIIIYSIEKRPHMNNSINLTGKQWIRFFTVKEGAPFKLTGREINSKLVISQNKHNGENSTIVMASRYNKYFFFPFSDIYYDCEHKEIIMPKMKPIFVVPDLDMEIVPSKKYQGCYVFSPHSDVDLIFKEIMKLDSGKKYWILAYNQINLYEYRIYDPCLLHDDISVEQLSMSQIVRFEKEERKRQRELDYDWQRETWDAMTDGMYGDMPDGFDDDYGFLGYD